MESGCGYHSGIVFGRHGEPSVILLSILFLDLGTGYAGALLKLVELITIMIWALLYM